MREVGSAGRVGSAERIREKRVSALGLSVRGGEPRRAAGRARGGLGRAGSGWDRAEGRRGHALKTLADLKVDLLVAVQRLVRAPLRGGSASRLGARASGGDATRGGGAVTRAEARREARGLREGKGGRHREAVRRRAGWVSRRVPRAIAPARFSRPARRFRRSIVIRGGPPPRPTGRARAAVAWCRQIVRRALVGDVRAARCPRNRSWLA